MRRHLSARSKGSSGFTLLELTVAAGLMTIIMVMLYTIFSSAGNIFSGSDSKIEIFQLTRSIVDTFQRDLQGCIVDKNGNVFRGWNRAYSASNPYSWLNPYTGNTADNPAVPTTTALTNSDPFRYLLCDRDNTYYARGAYQNIYVFDLPDMIWFRTTSEISNMGVPVEVIYRLGRGFVLEKGLSTRLTEGSITSLSAADFAQLLDTRFQFTPIAFHVREFQLRYYRADIVNVYSELRQGVTATSTDWRYGQPSSTAVNPPALGSYAIMDRQAIATHWLDYWPPRDGVTQPYVPPATWPASPQTVGHFDTVEARRARIPAAVQLTLRVGDSGDYTWTDYFSSNIIDGRDEPLPVAQFYGNRDKPIPEIDGIKQVDQRADEVGMVFRQVIFIPNYIKALGPKRSDL